MTAGDIIDRAARLYRRHALALLQIVLAPSLISYAGMILFSIGIGNFSLVRGDRRILLTMSLILGGGTLYVLGKAVFYAVLGGASRSLFNHFFDGAPIRAGEVYRSIRQRWWSLWGATFLVLLIVFGFGMILYFAATLVLVTFLAFYAQILSRLPTVVQVAATTVFGLGMIFVVGWAALLVYSRVVYVPQVLMVEGKEATQAISRSFSLAGGELRRIGALLLFWFYVAWSLWVLLIVPLGWYGYWMGLEIYPNPFSAEGPLWYRIAQQTLTQLSEILIAPIVMLGFTLLYLDTRVRKEGFDVEMLANRILPAAEFKIAQPSQPPPIQTWRPLETGEEAGEPAAPWRAPMASIEPVETVAPAEEIVTRQLETAAPEIRATAPVESGEPTRLDRSCRWCGTSATLDERFCRVCGSVF